MEQKRRAGRPRKFDEASVIAQAQQVFLAEGFEAVSYEAIGAATGLSKPSLYNSFGDKTALFERAVADYAAMAQPIIISTVEGKPSVAEAAKAMLTTAAQLYAGPGEHSVGCLLIGTSLPASVQNAQVRETLSGFITGLDDALAVVLARDYADELESRGKSAAQMALLFSSLLFSLAVRARSGEPPAGLMKVAEDLAAVVD